MVASLVACLVVLPPVAEIQVQGDGFLRFSRDGRMVYAKSSKLAVSGGKLCSSSGEAMMPVMSLPDDTAKLEVSLEGVVTAVLPNKQRVAAGQIVLALFANEKELQPDGPFLVARTRPRLASPGEGTAGVIRMASGTDGALSTQPATPLAAPKAKAAASPNRPTVPYKGLPVIVFRSENEVAGDTYRIGDVATVKAEPELAQRISELVLGNTPIAGIQHKVTKSWVIAVLRRINLAKDEVTIEMPDTVIVRRPSQSISGSDFVEAAIAYVKKQVPATVAFEGQPNGPDYVAPAGKLELRGESFSIHNGTTEVKLGIYVDGRRRNSRTVTLEARGADGEPLQKIPSGTRVKIVVRSGGASIAVYGKTKSAAFVGQTVEAVSDNRTTHQGVLVDPSTIEVKL